jgi:chorismate mutase
MEGSDADRDPVVRKLREQIAAVDRELVEAVNRRVALVRRLKEHKAERGHDFVDRAQEERLVERLEDANPGPISAGGLRELYRTLLELTKREA